MRCHCSSSFADRPGNTNRVSALEGSHEHARVSRVYAKCSPEKRLEELDSCTVLHVALFLPLHGNNEGGQLRINAGTVDLRRGEYTMNV